MASRLFDMSLRVDAPGPGGLAVANNLRFMARSPRYLLGRLERFSGRSVVPVTGGNGSIVVLRGPAASRLLFTDNETFQRPPGILTVPPGRPWSGMFDAVITANGAEHTRRRRLVMPAVHRTAVERYTEVFARTFAESRFAGGQTAPFDAKAEFLRISKANLLRCLLGLEPTPALTAQADVIVRLGGEALSPGVLALRRDIPFTPYSRWLRRVAWAYERLATLIERRRTEPPAPDALSILCHTRDESGDHLTTGEIVGELHGFFSAGFETSAMTMTVALLALVGSPDPAGAARADVDTATGLDAAVREAQRVMPVVPITLPRHTTRAVTVAETEVPAGAWTFVSPLLEHRDASVYPQPHRFSPARWTSAPGGPYTFMPFGMGPRRCLGAEFADAQVRTTLRLIAERGLPSLVTTEIGYDTVNGVVAGPPNPVVVDPARPATTLTRITGGVTASGPDSCCHSIISATASLNSPSPGDPAP
ncbi:cytochrome P450 [Dactylosporangium sp. CS-047395]|uniref:cytochrome P450 n=1 Tax=Dactylosporangium sp. CS-047395 TaxID=3239936 RepID=UPI003D930CE4